MSPSAARVAFAACLAGALLASCGEPAGRVELREASFIASDAPVPPPPDAGWSARRLPDSWAASQPPRTGFGWYRFDLPPMPPSAGDAGLYLTATQSNAQLFVNGRFAGQSGDLQGEPPQRWEAAQLFPIPRALLRDGPNTAQLRVFTPPGTGAGTGGGIGTVIVGPYEALYMRALRDQVGHTIGPAAVSLAMLILGGFMLILWLRVRDDRNYLLFSVAAIVWGLHTAATLLPRDLLPPPHWEVWWNAVYVFWVVLLCVFCVRFARAPWPRFERWAPILAAASLPALYLAAALGVLGPAAAAVRLGAIGAAGVALYAIIDRALRTRDATSWILLATGAVAAGFGVHDWLAAQRSDELRPLFLVPYVSIPFFVLVGWMMLERFVGTLRAHRQLNVELEARVAEKSRALEVEVALQGELRREAENANVAKSRFLAAASHDLRQPLHALGLFAAALDEREQEPSRRELTQRINQSIAALESLFNEVLDVSRLDAGAVVAHPRPVALQPLFERLGRDFAALAEEKELALRLVPTRLAVHSDPVLLERIVRNLIANAIRYTASGAVLVGVRRRGGRLAIEVRDSGIGIEAAHHESVFEEFYQVGNFERDRRQGLGLGLSIVRRLAALMGHEVTLASAPGRGSTFALVLDAAQAPAAGDEAAKAPGALDGLRVVVVDDEPDVRDAMATLLRMWGCEAYAHASADEALADPRAARPDAVLLDYRLRGGAVGVEAAKALRAAWGDGVPIVLVSGESSPDDLARMRASGLPMLHKPVPPAKLRSLLAWLRSAASDSPRA